MFETSLFNVIHKVFNTTNDKSISGILTNPLLSHLLDDSSRTELMYLYDVAFNASFSYDVKNGCFTISQGTYSLSLSDFDWKAGTVKALCYDRLSTANLEKLGDLFSVVLNGEVIAVLPYKWLTRKIE